MRDGRLAEYIVVLTHLFALMQPVIASPRLAPLRIECVGFEAMDVIRMLNRTIFQEERVINTFEREDLLMLVALVADVPCGFKIGYRENRHTFYSAKGGVLPAHRRHGVAQMLMQAMLTHIRTRGYTHFAFDTFPNRHPGMTVMALRDGFRLVRADFNSTYSDYRLRFEKRVA